MKMKIPISSILDKKLLPEIFLLLIFCFLAYYFSETPEVTISTKKAVSTQTTISEIKRQSVRNEKVMERNLFSLDGKYEGTVTTIPDEPYKLIAILMGSEKKAVLRDFNGQTFTAKVKDRLIDGYTLVEIRENSIVLKRDKKTKELFVFKQSQSKL